MAKLGLSQRAYAAHRGCSHTAVAKAIKSGRISTLSDGSIDPRVADSEWDSNTDPSKQRDDAVMEALPTAVPPEHPETPKAVPVAAVRAVDDILKMDAGDKLVSRPQPDLGADKKPATTFLKAKEANEVVKAQMAKLKLQQLAGSLVDRDRARTMVFELARRERDSWMNWPPRVAANMAAELEVDPHALEQVLDRFLREHLEELAEIKLDPR